MYKKKISTNKNLNVDKNETLVRQVKRASHQDSLPKSPSRNIKIEVEKSYNRLSLDNFKSIQTRRNKDETVVLNSYQLNDISDSDLDESYKTNFEYMALDPIDKLVFKLSDERDRVQKKTFTKWINFHLKSHGYCINNLFIDLRDGIYLIKLLEVLTNKPIGVERGSSKIHCLTNIQSCLDYLKGCKIRLVNIHKDDIFDGNSRITLGLIWILILYFQISNQSLNKDEMNAQASLLNWCQANLAGYDSVRVNNFSSSWRDGRALIAILNRHRPDKISFSEAHQRSNKDNLKTAFNFAKSELDIAPILDPEDIDIDTPDEKSLMTYISMIYNALPKEVPLHPSSLKEISHRKAILEEYSQKSRSLMEWLKSSILTMDNKHVPSDQVEIKKSLHDIKKFRLEEYAARLKEKKTLIQLSDELTNILDSNSENIENETKSVEKVWQKFDNYIQLRENLLERTLKKFEEINKLSSKLDKLITKAEKRIDQIKQDLEELISKANSAMNQIQVRSCGERFTEHFIHADKDLKKICAECLKLREEEHPDRDAYEKKVKVLQSTYEALKGQATKELELKMNTKKSANSVLVDNNNNNIMSNHSSLEQFTEYLAWIQKRTGDIQSEGYPEELVDIDAEVKAKEALLVEFGEKFCAFKSENYMKQQDKFKYNMNELEIANNVLFNETTHRIKCLNQLRELVASVNTQLTILDQKEDVEIGRDWSSPNKLNGSELVAFKTNFDNDLNKQIINQIQPILNKGQVLIDEKHPASNIIQVYIHALSNQLDWIQQLSHLLGVHLRDLKDLETFNSNIKNMNDLIDSSKRSLLDILSNSANRNYLENIEKTDELKNSLALYLSEVSNTLVGKSQKLKPFSMRKHKLRSPKNRAKVLVDFVNFEAELRKGEECTVDDNTQRVKWKIMTDDGRVQIAPSVCFTLLSVDEDSVNNAELVKKRCEALYRETYSCQRQFKKDRLLGLMNTIKFCELDEFDKRKESTDREVNLELMMKDIKVGVDDLLMNDSTLPSVAKLGLSTSINNDVKLVAESYERCCSKLDELNKKSRIRAERISFESVINADLECLESDLIEADDKLRELKTIKHRGTFHEFVEDLIQDLEDFQSQDLSKFDNNVNNVFRKLDGFQQHSHTSPTTRIKDNVTRQKLDHIKQQSSALRHDSENFSHNLQLVKALIILLENANNWISKFETRLCCNEYCLNLNELSQVLSTVQRLFAELDEFQEMLKSKQTEFDNIRDLYDRISSNKSVFEQDVSNLDEILEAADEIKKRNIDMFAQVTERNNTLRDILDAYDQYRRGYQSETKWIILLKNQILDYQHHQQVYKQQMQQIKHKYQIGQDKGESPMNAMEQEINELKSQFDPVAQTFAELGSKAVQIEELNQAGVDLIRSFQRYNQLLSDYRNLTEIESITTNTTPSRPNFAIGSQIRQELNNFNREYAGLLSDHNQKIKKITNTLTQADKHFTVHIKFQNAEPLIEKFNKDLFERYELVNELNRAPSSRTSTTTNTSRSTFSQNHRTIHEEDHIYKQRSTSNSTSKPPTNRVPIKQQQQAPVVFQAEPAPQQQQPVKNQYFYYDTVNKDFVDINSIDHRELKQISSFTQNFNSTETNTSTISNSNSSNKTSNMVESLKIVYPLSFIDSVNKKQLSLDSGLFRDPKTGLMNMRLDEALKQNLLEGKSAYFYDSHHNRTFNLDQALRHDILLCTDQSTIVSSNTNSHITMCDALKTGYLKIGQPIGSQGTTLHNNSSTRSSNSITNETQSMSVRSILDPATGEFLMPTEAIKRKLLDPYKGLFIHPKTGEQLPISDAIQKGLVIVEILIESPSSVRKSVSNNRDETSNIISTSLIRETKSYHLLGVYDPKKNDEISIKEAIAKGILDRQKGLYIHPVTRESFSISDAINKGVIRARVLPSNNELANPNSLPNQSLLSSNRFEENRTYTICGAIDLRTGKKLTLSQAIREGVIDSKNGTYVNLGTGETLSINKAIDANLVLTELGEPSKAIKAQPQPEPQRDIRTLNIEFVKDLRNDCEISVSEAMQRGLLDRQSLSYTNPLSHECLSLNKAYQKGYIIGHYTDSFVNENHHHTEHHHQQNNMSSSSTSHFHNQQYLIISVFDPVTQKSMSLDQAVHLGLFDHMNSVYIHPQTGELIQLNDAVRRGFVDAQIFEDESEGVDATTKRYDSRLPVDAFGIDKRITCMRTKFNKDGSSVLQVEIESLKPTRGIYEMDEVEDFSSSSSKEVRTSSRQEFRQVVDINSVQKIKPEIDESQLQPLIQPVNNIKHEKIHNVQQIDKEFGAHLDTQRVEKVIDDDRGVVKINIDHPKFRNNNFSSYEIPERKPVHVPKTFETIERKETLIINDVDNRRMNLPFNIDGQTHVVSNEVQIGNDYQSKIDFHSARNNVEELNRRLIEMESQRAVKRPETEIIDRPRAVNRFIDIDEPVQVKRQVDNGKLIIDITNEAQARKPVPVETIVDTVESNHHREVYVEQFPKVETQITEEIFYQPMVLEEEETFDEWTEVFTITIRNIRYKIIWVFDPIKNERVTLREAIKRGIISTEKNLYHNLKSSVSVSITEAVDDGLIGVEEDTSALIVKVNGITYTIYWVWDPVKKKRLAPKKAIERGVLNLDRLIYRNYANDETINIHEAVYLGLIGASDDLTDIEEELILEIDGVTYKIAWIKDSISKEKLKPRLGLKRGLLDLANYYYNKYETKEVLSIREAISQGFIGISNDVQGSNSNDEDSEDEYELNRNDSLVSLDDEELTIRTKKAIYVITGLLHPETQKEIKVSEAIESGILNKDKGTYRDFKTNVIYDVGEAINEGFVFATVTDLLQDETASTEFVREEIKRFIVKSVVDPRNKERVGGLQAQAAGILNYAQGMYTNPDTNEKIPISEAIIKNYIEVTLQAESSKEEFDAEVVTETLMERIVTIYRITGVLDPFSNEMISGSEAVHRQVIDTETNAYVDGTQTETIPIKEAVRRNLIKAEVSERIERKTLGLTLQNAMRLGLFTPETGKFRDPYKNVYFDLNQAIEKGHINPNGNAVADSSSGSMTLNEAFACGVFNKRTGCLDRSRLNMFKGRIVEGKIYKWNFEDAVKCGIINLKTGKYKHQQSDELLSIKDAINRGLIDGESTIIENPLTNQLMTLKQTLDTVTINDHGEVIDPVTNEVIINLEIAFNHRKIFSAFNENTGEIFLVSRGKIVPFEKAMRKNKMDKSVRIFDPKSNKDLTLNDALERAIIDKTSGMIIDPKGGGLLSIKEAVKRGIVSVTGSPVVTGHHENNETIEQATITSRRSRHSAIQFDEVNEHTDRQSFTKSRSHKMRSDRSKSSKAPVSLRTTPKPIVYDNEFLSSDFIRENPGVMTDMKTKTTIKTTTEEHTKRTNGKDVTEKVKADFKETVLAPGERPHVSSTALYEKQFKSKLPGGVENLSSDSFVKMTTEAFSNNTKAFEHDVHVNQSNGHKIEVKTHLNGINDSGKN